MLLQIQYETLGCKWMCNHQSTPHITSIFKLTEAAKRPKTPNVDAVVQLCAIIAAHRKIPTPTKTKKILSFQTLNTPSLKNKRHHHHSPHLPTLGNGSCNNAPLPVAGVVLDAGAARAGTDAGAGRGATTGAEAARMGRGSCTTSIGKHGKVASFTYRIS